MRAVGIGTRTCSGSELLEDLGELVVSQLGERGASLL